MLQLNEAEKQVLQGGKDIVQLIYEKLYLQVEENKNKLEKINPTTTDYFSLENQEKVKRLLYEYQGQKKILKQIIDTFGQYINL